jgi:hypothetical protein
VVIEYRFTLADGRTEVFVVRLDEMSMEMLPEEPAPLPEWTRLTFRHCRHCPLNPAEHARCPLAVRLHRLVDRFGSVVSHEELDLEVRGPERTVTQRTTAQRALGSFMGLVMATSGCPHLTFFRPMARFHLSLSNHEETVYRAASMYLLAQYYKHVNGQPADLSLEGLVKLYDHVHRVNTDFAERLRAAPSTDADALLNALVVLDSFAQLLPLSVRRSLVRLRHLFAPFFTQQP